MGLNSNACITTLRVHAMVHPCTLHMHHMPRTSPLPSHICLSNVLADCLVSHLICYKSTYFRSMCAPTYIVTYVLIASIQERAFVLIDTVYIDLTGQ
jgi:hypothetical protein